MNNYELDRNLTFWDRRNQASLTARVLNIALTVQEDTPLFQEIGARQFAKYLSVFTIGVFYLD